MMRVYQLGLKARAMLTVAGWNWSGGVTLDSPNSLTGDPAESPRELDHVRDYVVAMDVYAEAL